MTDHPNKKPEIRFGFRVDPELRDQFHAVAAYRGISASSLLLMYMTKVVREICQTDPRWKRVAPYGADRRIFGGCRSNKTAWKSALEEAGIDNLQRKDLRHWATTRITGVLAAAGLPYKHGMAVTGHTQEHTFRQYITTDLEMVRRIGKLLK